MGYNQELDSLAVAQLWTRDMLSAGAPRAIRRFGVSAGKRGVRCDDDASLLQESLPHTFS